MSFRQGQYVEFSKFKVISGKFTTFLLHWIVSSKSLSLNNLQKCCLIFSQAAPVAFLKIANPSSRDRARFFLSYFSDNLWSRKLLTSSHTSVPSRASTATSNNPLSFFIHVSLLLNRSDFQACLIIALSSVGMPMYSSGNLKALNLKALNTNRGSLIEEKNCFISNWTS